MELSRKSKKVIGYVNFPVNSKEFISSNEGGLFVELWVVPNKSNWMICAGGYGITSSISGSLVGTDLKQNKDVYTKTDPFKIQRFPLQEKLFPYEVDSPDEYNSIPLHACVTLGSTGWSGCSKLKGYWRATYNDLTSEGKALYNSFKKLYSNKASLLLVTWLDT